MSGDARAEPRFLRFVLAFSTTGVSRVNRFWKFVDLDPDVHRRARRHCQSASNSLLEVITVMVSHEHSACLGFVWNGNF